MKTDNRKELKKQGQEKHGVQKFFLRHILSFALLVYMELRCLYFGTVPGMLMSLGYFVLLFLAEYCVISLVRYFRSHRDDEE